MKNHKIEIANDTEQQDEFKTYLESLGYTVTIGNSTGSYVDGWKTDNTECPLDYSQLWTDYCNA